MLGKSLRATWGSKAGGMEDQLVAMQNEGGGQAGPAGQYQLHTMRVQAHEHVKAGLAPTAQRPAVLSFQDATGQAVRGRPTGSSSSIKGITTNTSMGTRRKRSAAVRVSCARSRLQTVQGRVEADQPAVTSPAAAPGSQTIPDLQSPDNHAQRIGHYCPRSSQHSSGSPTHRESVLPCTTLPIRRLAIFTSAASSLVPTCRGARGTHKAQQHGDSLGRSATLQALS